MKITKLVRRFARGCGAALVFSGLLAAPRPAQASCGFPDAAFSHGDGAIVPADPSVYLFTPHEMHWRIDALAGDELLDRKVTEVSRNGAFITYRVDIRSEDHTQVRVRLRGHERISATYTIDPSWKAPKPSVSPKIEASEYESHWMCSWQDSEELEVAISAPAYRVEIAGSRQAYDAGERSSQIFPHSIDLLWDSRGEHDRSGPGQISLGHMSCMGWTIRPEEYHLCKVIGVSAVYSDGSEVSLTPEPLEIDCHDGWLATAPAK